MDKLIVFIIISCILSLIVPDAFATLYNDQQNNISIKYPAEWTFDNFSVLEDSKKDKIIISLHPKNSGIFLIKFTSLIIC